MVKRGLGIAAFAVAAIAALGACADILGVQDLSNAAAVADAAPALDAGPDVDPRCAADPGAPRPLGSDGPSHDDLLLAVDSVDFGTSASVPGLNLDHRCTVDRATAACTSPASGFSATLDTAGGVDNSAFQALTIGAGISVASQVAAELASGNWTLLLRLRDYGGGPDDPSVVVQIATGFARSGTTWSVDDVSVDGGLDGALTSASAWVSGGVLVARFDDFPMVSRSSVAGNFVVHLKAAVVTGALDVEAKKITAGTVAGRWNTNDALSELARLRLGNVCLGVQLSNLVCSNRDIPTKPTDDGTQADCDAESLAFRFTAGAASFGDPPADGGGLSPQACAGAFAPKCP